MNNLNEAMQRRLDKWRENVQPVANAGKVKSVSIRPSRGDYGDAMTLEEWEMERVKSQTRK
jgi:hypothetical protein